MINYKIISLLFLCSFAWAILSAQQEPISKSEQFKSTVTDSVERRIIDTVAVALEKYRQLATIIDPRNDSVTQTSMRSFKRLFLNGGTQLIFFDIKEDCYSLGRVDDYVQDVRYYIERGVQFSLDKAILNKIEWNAKDSIYKAHLTVDKTIRTVLGDKDTIIDSMVKTYSLIMVYDIPYHNFSRIKIETLESQCGTLKSSTYFFSASGILQTNSYGVSDLGYESNGIFRFKPRTTLSTGFAINAMGSTKFLKKMFKEKEMNRLYWKLNFQYRKLNLKGMLLEYDLDTVRVKDFLNGNEGMEKGYQRSIQINGNGTLKENLNISMVEIPFGISYEVAKNANRTLYLDFMLHATSIKMNHYSQLTNKISGITTDSRYKKLNLTISATGNSEAEELYGVGENIEFPLKEIREISTVTNIRRLGFSMTPKFFFDNLDKDRYQLLLAFPITYHPTLIAAEVPYDIRLPLDFEYDENETMLKEWENSDTRILGNQLAVKNLFNLGIQIGIIYKINHLRYR